MAIKTKVKKRRSWKLLLQVTTAITLLICINSLMFSFYTGVSLEENDPALFSDKTFLQRKNINTTKTSCINMLCNHSQISQLPDGFLELGMEQKILEQKIFENMSLCGNQPIPAIITKSEIFQRVEPDDSILIISAFYDEGKVRILGVTEKKTETIFCRLWYKTASISTNYQPVTIAGTGEFLPKTGYRYHDVFFFCPVKGSSIPVAVSLLTKKCQPVLNNLEILNRVQTAPKRNFTVCLKPFHFNYSKAFALIEWIEFNLILGAEYFTFYNYTLNPRLNPILEWYSKRGLAEVLQWPLPMSFEIKQAKREIKTAGQIIAQNDCHFRNKYKSKYTVQIDVDEFIIPRNPTEKNWSQLFSRLPDADMYTFRNTFFKLEWPVTDLAFQGKGDAVSYGLNTLLRFVREEKISPAYQRSKYIARTDTVTTVTIHDVMKTKRNKKFTVSVDDGLLQHYRNWFNPADPKERITDTTVLKYKDELIKNVKEAWSQVRINL